MDGKLTPRTVSPPQKQFKKKNCGGLTARIYCMHVNPGQAPGFVVTGLRPSFWLRKVVVFVVPVVVRINHFAYMSVRCVHFHLADEVYRTAS